MKKGFCRRRTIFLALSGALCLTTSRTPAQNAPPAIAQMLERALADGEEFRRQLPNLEYDLTVRVKEFDKAGAVRGTGKAAMIVRPGAPKPITYISRERQGKVRLPNDESKAKDEADGEDETVPEFATKHQVRQRFDFALEGREPVAGENAYRVSFAPKPDQPEKNSADRFLDAIAGQGWVSEEKNRLVKFEMHLQHPFELFWVLAVLKEFSFRYELIEPGQILGHARIVFRFNLTTPIWSLRQEHEMELDHFRPRTSIGKSTTAG
jgi:hypothetical protein